MAITLNGLGWQATVHQQQRINHDQAQAELVPFRAPLAASNASAQQNSQGSTSQQTADDAREEAFAKLKVMLQNPDLAARQQAGASTQATSDAVQDFRDYMAKSPEEKIKEKILQELGMTEDDYNALPPEQQAKVDDQIAQRMKEDIELKTQAKVAAQTAQTEQV
ncbi:MULTISPECIES: hypothetical protein [unclassified Pseudomonas]|jgi:hypothetical protein|uniref:hypothetical protein n=1 Tax=Pseudomonas TaxID=286 RepID=UPI0006D3C9AC|nr:MULTISPECIES: hypothetical protein [unclassified Pseudomonas]AXQ47338.1 hypothetical protein DZC31_07815 [Stenotrophomonas rhizophila]MBS3183967.1 hypothetical protein [Pseudomonas sp. PCH44]PIK79443.1 hypothetical protein CQW31_07635 [Pseudomonas sp. 382]